MSMDFNVYFSGKIRVNLAYTIYEINNKLKELGYNFSGYVSSLCLDSNYQEEVNISYDNFMNGRAINWKGCSATFSEPRITIDIIIRHWHSRFLNINVGTNANIVFNNYEHKNFEFYVDTLLEILKASHAIGAVGGFNFSPEIIPPENIISFILKNPDNSNYPADIGMISKSDNIKDKVYHFFSESFMIYEKPECWLLIGKGLIPLLEDYTKI